MNDPMPPDLPAPQVVAAGTRPRSLARPSALRPGDRIAVLSVSSPVGQADLRIGFDTLRFARLDPVVYPSAQGGGSMRPYLAGDDKLRAGDLRAALDRPVDRRDHFRPRRLRRPAHA